MNFLRNSIPIVSLVAAVSTASAQLVISGINGTELPRSGRVAIQGSGFGASGEVVIAGINAWTSTWTDTRIVAYVPETAPVGAGALHVVAGGEQSNEIGLTVTLRQSDGRVRWTFEADGDNLWYRPARAPDGTLYLHTNNETDGIVYALSPEGGLLWVQHVQWYPIVPPTAGPDGTVYVGTLSRVSAFSAQGQLLWDFNDPDAQHIQVAATIGPDGRVYGASDLGMGAFALDPANGELQWSNTGDPFMYDFGNPFGTEVKFGPSQPGGEIDQLYVHMDGNDRLYGFTLDGNQRFAASAGGGTSHEPVVGSDGTIYTPFGGPGFWALKAIDPDNGATLWTHQPEVPNTMTQLAIGPDDTLYYFASGRLEALNPTTQALRWIDRNFMVMGWPSVSPDGSTLVVDGVSTYGEPGFIKGYDAATGQELWNVDLPGEPYPGFRVLGTHHPRITPDGATAYVSTFTVADGSPFPDPVSYLYAVEIGPETRTLGDLDGDGAVGILDLLQMLGSWGPCGDCADCPADLDGDCAVGITDLLILLANWG
jgi:outer membrane protein assembly factor BamB